MFQEIRLYYESIEQARHYILPLIQEIVKEVRQEIGIKLVKMEKEYFYYSKRVAPVLFWKKPDILMTVVENDEEYPILLVEFSTAVFTEDHELQRFDGMLAAAKNNCIYIKISPTKKESPYNHGGKKEFDYVQPFRLIYSKYNKPYFHFEWECDEKGILKTNHEFLSCPERIPEFEILLRTIVKEVINGYSIDWINNVCGRLQNYNYFKEWLNKLKSKLEVDMSTLNTSRTRWIKKDPILGSEALEVKLNRFGHAMDPERGMLAYYGTLTSNVISKMVFSKITDAWYKDIPKEKEIKHIIHKELRNIYHFLLCFALGSGLYANKEFMKIIEKYKNYSEGHVIIDLTEFIQKTFPELSKPLKTIFTYSKIFVIEDDDGQRRVTFVWKPYQEAQAYEDYPKITLIKERKMLDEDDVTYLVVHSILKPNGYKIIAVSYPGAQGDRRILIQAGTGRRQPRKYIDIISFLPDKVTSLEENKGIYNVKEVQSDINELSLYKTNKTYKEGLRNFLGRFAPEAIGTSIKIGVGFWANRSFTVSHIMKLDLKDLDYFVYVTKDRKQWKIWINGKDSIFSITSGRVSLPETYEIIKGKHHPKELSNFFKESVLLRNYFTPEQQ
ncbi:MAG: hypothetical protein ACP5ML_02955 [Fervidicoccus sp.]